MKADVESLVIIGGGFAGATLAQHAERLMPDSTRITVISRDNHLVFTPMLPELAGRSVSASSIAVPGRSMTKRTAWFEGTVTTINRTDGTVEYQAPDGAINQTPFSHAVIACGSESSLEGVPGLKAHGLTLKSAGDALLLSNEVIGRFEAAASQKDEAKRSALLHAVVIGGGFSGVEVAGQINDLMEKLVGSYPEIAPAKPCVTVLQRGKRVLPDLNHERLSDFALRKLREGGIEVLLETSAKEVTEEYVLLDSGQRIPSRLVICTIGTEVAPLIAGLGLELEKGRVKTEDDMRAVGHQNIWAIGDCAVTRNAFDGKPTPPTAQFALRQAEQLARNIASVMNGRPTLPFRFRPQGLLASIGRRNGVAEIFGLQFSGFFAWMLWRAIYLPKIPGVASKFGVAFDWLSGAIFPPSLTKIRLPGNPQPRRVHYAEGDVVFVSKEAGNAGYFIENGNAAVYIGDAALPAARLEKGDYFGNALFTNEDDSVSDFAIKAEKSLDVIVVDGREFSEFADSFSPIRAHLADMAKARTILTRLIHDQSSDPANARMTVEDVMFPLEERFSAEATLGEALMQFNSSSSGYWVTTADHELEGFLGRLELYAGLANHPETSPVSDFLREAPQSVRGDQDLVSATLALLRTGLDNIPVADEHGRVIGLYDPLRLIQERSR